MFNFDMVGRLRDGELTVNGVRTAEEFPELVDKANADENLKLKKVDRVVRSGDHFDFYQKGIPSFHFFTGFTSEYHTPEDDLETLNMEGIVQTVDYTERLLDQVLALPQRPQYVKATPTVGGAAYLGVIPNYTAGEKGLRISQIVEDSPAAKGNLKTGDVILKVGEFSITDVPTLIGVLRRHKPGDKVKVTVLRAQKEVVCNVTLGRP
jgi:C-terminal processing protease CtpA/Prc